MARYGSGSVPIATGWKCTNCRRTHRSSIPRSASGNTRARPALTTDTSRPPRNWSAPCPGSSERCNTILSQSDPICFLFADRYVPLIMRGCISSPCVAAASMEGSRTTGSRIGRPDQSTLLTFASRTHGLARLCPDVGHPEVVSKRPLVAIGPASSPSVYQSSSSGRLTAYSQTARTAVRLPISPDIAPEEPGSTTPDWGLSSSPSADSLTIGLYPDLGELDSDERFAVPGMTIGPQSGVHLLGVESQNRTAALPLDAGIWRRRRAGAALHEQHRW